MAAPVRLGLIGVGRWGKVYLRTILSLDERCRLTHLATSKPEHAALVPYPVTVTSDWRDVVRSACDAVIIATPPHTHAEILEACLEAGKPCIVEKPLCLDVPTAERLHQRVERSGVPVLVDHALLFNPAYVALKQRLHETREPIRVILSEGMALGPFRTEVSALWDWAPHDLSLCLDLLGQPPAHVAALGGPEDPRGAPELVSVRLEFTGGACAWIQTGRLSPVKRRTLNVFTDTRLYRFDALAHDQPQLSVASVEWARREQGGIPEELEFRPIPPVSDRLPMASLLTYFLDGLAGGDRRAFGTALALDVVRLLAKCEAAVKEDAIHAHGAVS